MTDYKAELEGKIAKLKEELAKLEEDLAVQDMPALETSKVCLSCES